MSKTHNKHEQKQELDESDCQDCKRQRVQNKKLILMYEKIKNMETKLDNVNQNLQNHLKSNNMNRTILNTIVTKLKIVDDQLKKHEVSKQIIGIQIASSVIEKQIKLKQEIEQKKLLEQSISLNKQLKNKWRENQQLRNSISFNRSKSIDYCENNKNYQKTQETTVTDQFNFNTNRSINLVKQKKQIEDHKQIISNMSLWLFQNQQNNRLQRELYIQNKKIYYNQRQKRLSRYAKQLPQLKYKQLKRSFKSPQMITNNQKKIKLPQIIIKK